ncbi:MAG: VOC family protein [Nanoarchaeota archaeon]
MVTTTGVHHITLIVRDLKKSKEFYQNVCGMEVVHDEEDVCGLTDGMFSLWLAHSNEIIGKDDVFNPEHLGLNHWAFRVDNKEDLGEIEEALRKMEIEMEEGGITDDGYGGTAIFTKDPDGMKVEFHLQE